MTGICTNVGCGRNIHNKKHALCQRCYGYFLTIDTTRTRCSVENCQDAYVVKGLCSIHYKRARRNNGDPTGIGRGRKGIRRGIRSLKGEYIQNGYKRIRTATGSWELEHRYVMQKILGRPLIKDENVHHINGNRLDNRPENLELWVKPQPQGLRVIDAINWANEIIARYGEKI